MRFIHYIINFAFWIFFVLSSIVLFVGASLIWFITLPFDPNKRILQQYSCFWSTLYVWVNPFWSIETIGKENYHPRKAYVMVSNHKSLMDILILFNTFLHFKWVSKASLFKSPLLGWNMKLNGYVPINRGDPKSREKCMSLCKKWLKKGSSVFFFPEGTRSRDGRMGEFKLGAFRLALETGTDILPMAITGSENAVPKHSLILTKKTKMKIQILPPISVKDYDLNRIPEEAARLAHHVSEVIKAAMGPDALLVRAC